MSPLRPITATVRPLNERLWILHEPRNEAAEYDSFYCGCRGWNDMRPSVPLPYVRDLMKKNYEAVGFIPLPQLENYAERGQILTQYENGEPCGYLAFGNGWPVLKVYQCCIQVDARRAAQATELVNRLIDIARERNCVAISLWCADDLESNGFWQAMGFHFGGQREGGQKRGRRHNKWTLLVSGTAQLNLFGEAA